MASPLVLLCASLVATAQAGSKGLVVRLESRGATLDAPVAAVLADPAGAETSIALADDGAAPDVNAGDGVWSGTQWADGDTFTVSVTAGGKRFAGGEVSWKAEDVSRDLTIRLNGESLELDADVAPMQGAGAGAVTPIGPNGPETDLAPPTGEAGAAGGSPTGSPGPSPGTAPVTAAPGNPGSADNNRADPSTLYIAFGVGLVSLAGVGWLWARSRTSAAAALVRLPEPGVFGDGTPALGEGPIHLVIAPEDRDAALPLVVRTLAAFHPVIVVGYVPPPVPGGPIYRADDPHPAAVGDAADGLLTEGRVPVMLMVPGPTGAALAEWREMLPKGTSVLGVVERLEEGAPTIELRREGANWSARSSQGTVSLRVGPLGLEAVA